MKTTKYFTIYFILFLTYGLSQSVTIGQNLMPPMPFDGTEEVKQMPLTAYDYPASDSLYEDFLSNIIANSNNRDSRVVYTFTTCGQSGRFGPSQNQANAAYSGSNISVAINNGVQEWTVPATGNYVIEAYGARGGNGSQLAVGDYGEGAYMKGTFALYEGDKLQILVGQEGSYDSRYGGGGGGGSFVAQGTSYGNATPLIIAGGGGGGGYNSGSYVDGQAGSSGSNGGAGSIQSYRGPGIGGNNGMGATGSTYGGNAGGFYSNGSGNYNNFSEAGVGFRNGGNGGNGQYGGLGGFGGGAGGYGGAGGGGGYSGGGGGAWAYGGAGGGGGSYNSGLNQNNLAGSNNSHGVVVITSTDVLTNTAPIATAQTVTGNEDETQTITLIGSDVDGDNLTFALASDPSNGTTILNGNVVTYTPAANFSGYDNFYFTVSDGEATSETATIHITLTAVNDAPSASVLLSSGNEDETQTIALIGNDVDSDDLTYILVNDPAHGTVSLNSVDASTTHSTADFIDPENVNKRLALSSTGWEGSGAWNHSSGIYVGPHVSVQPQGFSTPDGDGYFVRNYPGQSSSKYAITKSGTSTISSNERGNITFTADWASNRNLGARFVAIVNGTWYASDQFGMGANDHGNMNQTRVIDWKVDQSVNADTDNWYVSLAGSPSGYAWRDGNQWSTTPVSGGGLPAGDITQFGMAWLQTGNGDYGAVDNFRVINGSGGSDGAEVTYTPNQNYNGLDSFTYAVSDGETTSENGMVTINVLPVNDLPTINSIPTLDVVEGELYEYPISLSDLDGDYLSLFAPTRPAWLNVINSNTHSLSFDGIDDYVEIADSDILDGMSQLTIQFHLKWDSYPFETHGKGVQILKKWQTADANATGSYSFYSHHDADMFTYMVQTDNDQLGIDIGLSTNMSIGTWYHVVGVYDGENLYLYLNGDLKGQTEMSGNVASSPCPLELANQSNYNTTFFDGSIDEISIWNIAHTQDQIQNSAYTELNGNETGLIGYWNFNSGEGTNLNDLTENGNHGYIHGAAWSTEIAYPFYKLSGSPSFTDGGLSNIILEINDSNGGMVSQEYAVSVAVRHLEISGESGFRILSSPISGPVLGDLLEELWTQGSVGSDHEGADPNVWRFDNGWVPISDLYNDHLEPGEGFVIYVYSDTDYDGEDDLPVTIGVDGILNESSVSISSNASDWNLIGNPYGLHININQMLDDNSSKFHSTVYIKDNVNPGYKTHNGIVGDIHEGLIKPFDGFWVQAGPEGHSFDFSEHCMQKGHMVHNGGARSVTDESIGSTTFTFSNGEFTSSVYLSFTEHGEINLDPADAKRIIPMSPAEHLTSMVRESNKSLSINNLPYDLTTDLALELDVMLLSPNEEGYDTQAGQVNLTWDVMDLPDGISLTLVNNFTGQNINLYGFPSANINVTTKGGFDFPDEIMQSYPFVDEAQFSLHVSSDFASSNNDEMIIPDEITLNNAYPNPFNPSTTISFELVELGKVSLNIFDLTGRQVASLINNDFTTPGYHKINWNPGSLPSGIYIVELVTSVKSFNQKITYIK